MPHVVNDKCYKCKYTDCATVCPVDCFHEGDDILVIDPDVCIDCGVCIPECPLDAIVNDDTYIDSSSLVDILKTDSKDLTYDQKKIKVMAEYNNIYSKIWPVITKKKNAHAEEEVFNKISDKIEYIDKNFKDRK